MKALAAEFRKVHGRRVWVIVAALIGVQLLWELWSLRSMDAAHLRQGWLYLMYEFPMLNTIFMPVVAAVVASRLCDEEHKGQTLKLLETVMPAGRLFDAKFLCGAVYMAASSAVQVVLITVSGIVKKFPGEIPAKHLALYFVITCAVSLTLYLAQQVFSLLFVNQMIPLAIGIAGAFIGLFSLFFPQTVQKLFLWSYYGVLMFVRMDWDRATRITNFYITPTDWSGFLLLGVLFCLIYGIGRTIFVRKEI